MKPFHDVGACRGRRAAWLCAGLMLMLPLSCLHAKTGDRNQPMNTSQDSVSGYNAPNTMTTLTGHVVVTQGTMKATGEVAYVYFDANQQVSRIVMKGKPAHIQQLDDKDKLMTGEAPTLDWDNVNSIAVLYPQGVVTEQDEGEAHADKLTYNTNTTYFTGTGNVSMTYLPKPKPEKGAAPATQTAAQPAPASTAPSPKSVDK
jgi:lipopolysaccharide export system protein LptA